MKTAVLILTSMAVGSAGALLISPEFVLVPIAVPLVLCILLAWYIAFQSKAVQLTPFRWFFRPWINLDAPLPVSRALQALRVSASLVSGGCLGLLIQVMNA